MVRGSDRHGPRTDEALEREVEPIERSAGPAHADEWRDPEPAGDDQPATNRTVGGYGGGTPSGINADDIEQRADLGRRLRPSDFPCGTETLLATATEQGAPAATLALLAGLPSGGTYENVQQVWEALGGGREQRP